MLEVSRRAAASPLTPPLLSGMSPLRSGGGDDLLPLVGKASDGAAVCAQAPAVYRRLSSLARARASLALSTALLVVDQYLDGGVLVSLSRELPTIALVLASSIVMPQLLAWTFLFVSGLTTRGSVDFIPTGRPEGQGKWFGIAALMGRLYCAPFGDPAVLVVEPEGPSAHLFPTGRQDGGGLWTGIAASGGKLYCAPHSSPDVLVIEPPTSDASAADPGLSFLPTGRQAGAGKWSGIAALDGFLYCAPFNSADVLAIDSRTGHVALCALECDTCKAMWAGIAAIGEQSALWCSPARHGGALRIDPANIGVPRAHRMAELGLRMDSAAHAP